MEMEEVVIVGRLGRAPLGISEEDPFYFWIEFGKFVFRGMGRCWP